MPAIADAVQTGAQAMAAPPGRPRPPRRGQPQGHRPNFLLDDQRHASIREPIAADLASLGDAAKDRLARPQVRQGCPCSQRMITSSGSPLPPLVFSKVMTNPRSSLTM
jgi:hypothetical protein